MKLLILLEDLVYITHIGGFIRKVNYLLKLIRKPDLIIIKGFIFLKPEGKYIPIVLIQLITNLN